MGAVESRENRVGMERSMEIRQKTRMQEKLSFLAFQIIPFTFSRTQNSSLTVSAGA